MFTKLKSKRLQSEREACALTFSILVHAARNLDKTGALRSSQGSIPITRRLRMMLLERYGDCDLSIDALSNELNVSRSYLSRQFRKDFAIPPVQFLRSIRLKRGMDLLKDPTMPISRVAASCGFSSSSYFAKAFNDLYGVTPTEFRQRSVTSQKRMN